MSETTPELGTLTCGFLLPSGFEFGAVPSLASSAIAPSGLEAPGLGPLAAFIGTFTGHGFNTIFRPDIGSPTLLPTPPTGPADNLLELNLTAETLSFSSSLGSVPNRGEVQPDIFLNGIPYLQTISDITDPAHPIGIHFEPGLWMSIPATTDPAEGATLVRMASIPHGTTICAQGTSQLISGPPTIPPVSITPPTGRFPSQTAAASNTRRIPQDLSAFIKDGTITQAILDDPNTVLRNAIAGQTITSTAVISIATSPASPLFGGGTDNMAFLLGDKTAVQPNAQTTQMTATFWIETVQQVITVPASAGQSPLTIPATATGRPAPAFRVQPPGPITEPRTLTVTSTQIQYSQKVVLNFNGILWPHVSVATLVPSDPITIPASALA